MIHRYVRVIVPVLGQINTKSKQTTQLSNTMCMDNIEFYHIIDFDLSTRILSVCRLPVRRSPTQIHHFSPSALPLKEFHSYHDDMGMGEYDQYRTSSIGDSHLLLNHPHHEIMGGYPIDDDASYLYDIGFGNVIHSRTQTTILPFDYPLEYESHHRASI